MRRWTHGGAVLTLHGAFDDNVFWQLESEVQNEWNFGAVHINHLLYTARLEYNYRFELFAIYSAKAIEIGVPVICSNQAHCPLGLSSKNIILSSGVITRSKALK